MTALTLANQLTLLRMLLIPAFVILVTYGHLGWALFVFVTAGVTDALDGLIARVSGQKTILVGAPVSTRPSSEVIGCFFSPQVMRIDLDGVSIARGVQRTGGPVRVDSFGQDSGAIAREARTVGIRASVGCPIVVGGRLWG